MEHTKVSIITVVYNDVKNIELTIKNTLNQTYQNLEIIVIDGAQDLYRHFWQYLLHIYIY